MAFLGLCAGSFAGVLIARIPRDEDIFITRSHCEACNRTLTLSDLIPVYSWLSSGGKCRTCNTKLSLFYPMVELLMACSFSLLPLVAMGYAHLLLLALLVLTLWAIIFIDIEYLIIPDGLTITLGITGLMYALAIRQDGYMALILSVASYAGLALALRFIGGWVAKKEALGWGDVKFIAVTGLFLPLYDVGTFLLLAGVLGVVMAAIWRLAGRGAYFPFGPALCVSLAACTLYPALSGIWLNLLRTVLA